jgi:membrane peptidoglycan carboxypeptidase
VVEPGTGRVLGYYGGADGLGNDYAGFYYDEANEATGVGRHPPGSSFMVYTLATALRIGISLQSRWQWTPHRQVGRDPLNPIRNASTCQSDRNPMTGVCTLLESTTSSLFVPMYDVTATVSPSAVLETARDAGIDYLWTDARERVDLRAPVSLNQLTPSKFDLTVGIGQYPVTVLDQANAMATFAAGGLRSRAHFVASVKQGDEVILAEPLPRPDAPRVLTADQVADLTYALSNGTDTAVKTGTWEFGQNPVENSHAWSLGYTSGLAMAVWIGNKTDEQPLRDATGGMIYGAGLPTTLLRRVLGEAQTALGRPPTPFPPPAFGGRVDPPGAVTG